MHGMHGAADADPLRPGLEIGDAVGEGRAARVRAADKWIAQRLREVGYDLAHPIAQLLADHLQATGVGTLINMEKSNKLLSECEKLVTRKLPPPPESWHHESQRLIVVAVRQAIPRFITRSMRTWDPERSALFTYFVNYCLFELKKVYLEYCREELQGFLERPTGDVINMFETRAAEGSTEDLAIARHTIREITTLMGDQKFAQIVILTANGLTRKQIAESLGISISSLDRYVSEYRSKLEHGGWARGR